MAPIVTHPPPHLPGASEPCARVVLVVDGGVSGAAPALAGALPQTCPLPPTEKRPARARISGILRQEAPRTATISLGELANDANEINFQYSHSPETPELCCRSGTCEDVQLPYRRVAFRTRSKKSLYLVACSCRSAGYCGLFRPSWQLVRSFIFFGAQSSIDLDLRYHRTEIVTMIYTAMQTTFPSAKSPSRRSSFPSVDVLLHVSQRPSPDPAKFIPS